MKIFISFIVGLLFSLGLGYSGMTQVNVVRGFLDPLGDWNGALMGVMIGAIGVHSILYFFIRKRKSPLLDTHFHVPTKKDIDKKLLIGAALFGLGWGWTGICPGPGIVSLLGGEVSILLFVLSMLAGMAIFKFVEKRFL
jgi:uncharacterized membrane protein YedE/YeeE